MTEIPVAFVQCKTDANLEEHDVIEYCRGKVATFKIPKHVVFVDEFPMTASGKIRKVELRDTAIKQLPARTENSRG